MKIKDRYITKTLLTFTFVVFIIWIGIYGFFNFLAELDEIGNGSYTILEAIKYIVLIIPEVAYGHASSIILLGCVLGMGHLATTNQLVVMRISGISIFKLTFITVRTAIIFIVVFIAIGEGLAPYLSEKAKKDRSSALGFNLVSQNQEGFWIKDGNNIINVQKNFDGALFSDITIFEINASNKINTIVNSSSAVFDGQSLNLGETSIYSVDESKLRNAILFQKKADYIQTVSFDKDLIESLKKHPEDLTTWKIFKQIQFLSDNKLRAGLFEVELYKRLIKPVTLIAMILLAMLFIFGTNRDATLGRKIFFGIAVGLSFELISRVGGAMSLGFNFSPLISAILPTITVLLIAMILVIYKSIH